MGDVNGLHGYVADMIGQHKMNAPILNLFVLSHGTEECGRRVRRSPCREASFEHQVADASLNPRIGKPKMEGQSRRRDHSNGHGLTMLVTTIICYRFQGMTQCVPEVKDTPPVAFPFIFRHDLRFDSR